MSNAALEHDAMALMRQTELDFGLTIDAGPLARSRARFTRTVIGLHALNK